MFEFDSKIKIEALNFATIMNCLKISEKKLDPEFERFSSEYNSSVLLEEDSQFAVYADFFHVDSKLLKEEYCKAKEAFSSLNRKDEIIKRGTEDYPELLAKTKEAPRFLYIRGKKALLSEKRTVALVGSRKASLQSCENTKRLAVSLGRNGITVISGLATGIDTAAHTSALSNGFNTIAVIGTNLNQYYPSENKALQLQIEKKGLVVSQFSPATKTQKHFFLLRNGTMSGLSLATVIMEAGETSGALKQADYALKQDRLVLIPETAMSNPNITWPAKYQERGARVFKTPREVQRILAESSIFNPGKAQINHYNNTIQKANEVELQVAEPMTIWDIDYQKEG